MNHHKNENDNIIEVNGLTKRFGNLIAVNQISFNVKKGEIFGFLGPNGAGKTTTIRMLTGILSPDSGDALIAGLSIRREPVKVKMKMGIIPEIGNVYADLTSKQNIILSGKFYGIPRRELYKTADDLLRKFDLYERRNEPVKTLSKGLKQRVNIACAIAHAPEILFLDEPTSGLDVQSQRMIRAIIKEMHQNRTTIFLTTHNIEEANVLCERVGIINKGEIAAVETPERLKRIFQESQSVEASFNKPFDPSLIKNNKLVSKMERSGDKFKLYTDDPDKLVKFLAKFAHEQGLAFISMEICGPSLEDTFIRLTETKNHND